MKYLNWVLKEALRLNPPVASNQREAVRDTILPRGGGPDGKSPVFVEARTTLRYIPWVMHRRKDVFGDDAEEFRPERWEKLRVTYVYACSKLLIRPRVHPGCVYAYPLLFLTAADCLLQSPSKYYLGFSPRLPFAGPFSCSISTMYLADLTLFEPGTNMSRSTRVPVSVSGSSSR